MTKTFQELRRALPSSFRVTPIKMKIPFGTAWENQGRRISWVVPAYKEPLPL